MDAVFFIGVINLFFVPILPVYRYYRKTGQPIRPSLELLFQYAISVALNIPIAKILIFLPSYFLHDAAKVVSSYFTIAALIAACLQPVLIAMPRNISIRIEWKKNERDTEREGAKDGDTAE